MLVPSPCTSFRSVTIVDDETEDDSEIGAGFVVSDSVHGKPLPDGDLLVALGTGRLLRSNLPLHLPASQSPCSVTKYGKKAASWNDITLVAPLIGAEFSAQEVLQAVNVTPV